MIRTHASIIIMKPANSVFEYVADGFFQHYQRWCPEVIHLQAISSGPVKLGTRGRQIRMDMGFRSECDFRVTSYEPVRRIDFQCVSPPMLSSYRLDQLGERTRLTFLFVYSGSDFFLGPLRSKVQQTIQHGAYQIVSNIKILVEATDRSSICSV
ncbi:MAG: SRPBCC family protein [Gammaproteobacteria bacterium]|nr:SRPBCC family protein [Gammaproteobacteria bacterium]